MYHKVIFFRRITQIILLLLTINPSQAIAAFVARSMPIICNDDSQAKNPVNKQILTFLEKWQMPGASVAVMHDNKLILSCGYGWANIETHQLMRPDSLFRIASISKTITAITILKLIEEKKINLDDKVFSLLKDLKPIDKSKPNADLYKISIRNLLQMSSGWYSDRPEDYDPLFGPWSDEMLKKLNYQIPPDCETAAQLMMSMPLQFSPGTKFSYSNISYCLLGLVVKQMAKKDAIMGYEPYVKKNILAPLGIKQMQLGSTNIENNAPKEVKYYAEANNTFKDIDRTLDGLPYSSTELLKKNNADGGWIASAPELVKLLQALYDNRILSLDTKKTMLEKPLYSLENAPYPAIGWDEVKLINGSRYISKTGSFTGTMAFILQSNAGVSYAALFNIKPANSEAFIKELIETLILIDAKNYLHYINETRIS